MSESTLSELPTPKGRDLTWLGLMALAILVVASICLVHLADETKPADWNSDQLTYLPSGKILKPMAMDLDEAVADGLWIRAMMYFSDAYLAGKGYGWLGHMLDVITILNPRMHNAYDFGGVVLTKDKQQLPGTLRLLDRGIGEFPKEWQLRLYAAMAQLALDSNYIKAAEYLKPITLDEKVPDHIRTMAASWLNKGQGKNVALAFLVDRYIHSQNPITREIFVDKMLKLYPGPPEKYEARKETVTRILHEITLEPMATMMGLGVMDEYLSDHLSPNGRKMLDLLYQD